MEGIKCADRVKIGYLGRGKEDESFSTAEENVEVVVEVMMLQRMLISLATNSPAAGTGYPSLLVPTGTRP